MVRKRSARRRPEISRDRDRPAGLRRSSRVVGRLFVRRPGSLCSDLSGRQRQVVLRRLSSCGTVVCGPNCLQPERPRPTPRSRPSHQRPSRKTSSLQKCEIGRFMAALAKSLVERRGAKFRKTGRPSPGQLTPRSPFFGTATVSAALAGTHRPRAARCADAASDYCRRLSSLSVDCAYD